MAPAPALAGAWVAPEGGQEIVTTVAGKRDDLNYYESSAYWEAPIGRENSIVAAPWVEQNYDTDDGWRGEATLGVKHALVRTGAAAMAVQAGALWMSHPDEGCGEGGAEVRYLAGVANQHSAFVNAEVAARVLEGGCGGERIDLTAGYRPAPNWMLMGQVFADRPREGESSVKVQVTLVRFGESGRGLQFGLRARIDGGSQEPALVIGFWGRPRDD